MESSLTDGECIERCLERDADDFGLLVTRYERAVIAYLRSRMRHRDRAQEAAQETFVRAYFNLAKLKKRESFFCWLLGIATHVARETDRREQKERGLSEAYAAWRRVAGPPSPHPDEDLALEAAVSSLAGNLKEVILLRFYADRSCLEISQTLALPLGTVTKRLSRASRLIRRRIEK